MGDVFIDGSLDCSIDLVDIGRVEELALESDEQEAALTCCPNVSRVCPHSTDPRDRLQKTARGVVKSSSRFSMRCQTVPQMSES